MSIGPIRAVTVGVRSLDASLALFRDVIGLRVESDVELGGELLDAWCLATTSKARAVELSCEGHPAGRLRLVEYDPPANAVVRADASGPSDGEALDAAADIGPKAIDLYTSKPIDQAAAELERAGYPARSRPIRYEIGGVKTEELLFTGPDGIPILVMRGDHGTEFQRPSGTPTGYSEIPTLSVVCADLDESRRFYGETLGLSLALDAEVAPELQEVVCELTGVPPGTRTHMLLYMDQAEPSGKYLLLHYFSASQGRLRGRMRPGRLGTSLYSHFVDDFDGVHRRLVQSGAEILTAPRSVDTGNGVRARLLLACGPNEELFELVERE